jgi:ABC-type Fe3+ transport system permease subunit
MTVLFLNQEYTISPDPAIAFTRFVQEHRWFGSFLFGTMGAVYATSMVRLFDVQDMAATAYTSKKTRTREVYKVLAFMTGGLVISCFSASVLYSIATFEGWSNPQVWDSLWNTVYFQTIAAGIFGLVSSILSLLTFRHLGRAREVKSAQPSLGNDVQNA